LASLKGNNGDILTRLEVEFGANEKAAEGIRRLRELVEVARAVDLPETEVRLDLSIARGLDYYTGTVFETFLKIVGRLNLPVGIRPLGVE
jgi:histidyl-tRNA synthetase